MDPIVIIGPGATGGLLAATLVRAGLPVSLLCRDSARAARLRRQGLTITGATKLRVAGKRFRAVSHKPALLAPARAIFLCVKSHDSTAAIREAKELAAGGAAVVSLLNGLAHVADFQRHIPERQRVHGVGFFSAWRSAPTDIHHAGGQRILLASPSPSPLPKGEGAALIESILKKAGWESEVVDSVDSLLWTKLALNAAINPLAALSGRLNGGLEAEPPLKELLERAAGEGEAVLKALRIRPLQTPLAAAASELCRNTAGNVNSMLADLRRGRKSELSAILAPLLDAARRKRVATPVLSSLYDWTRALEAA